MNPNVSPTSPRSLDAVFRPRSVAVIGASRRTGSIGWEILHNLIQFGMNGKVFPVNPRADAVHSIKSYPSVLDIPDPVELAIIVVAKERVLDVAEECGRKGVGALVVISAGFKEIGEAGLERERRLQEIAKLYGMRLVGPNCMGVMNTDPEVRLNATFAPGQLAQGNVAFMSQSGALGVAILNMTRKISLGLSYFASVGNKADVSGNDLICYWEDDPRTKVILLYLESFGNPRRFTQIARRVTRQKPIVVVKSGRTEAGARAVSSHTGALAGADVATTALLDQCGVLRCRSIDEMCDVAHVLSACPLPQGNRVVIVTNAGGPAIMATDACVEMGLQMAGLSETARSRLRSFLPPEASVNNPVDMIASAGAQEYRQALEVLTQEPDVDMVVVIFVPPLMIQPMDIAGEITALKKSTHKTIVGVFMAPDEFYSELAIQLPGHPPIYRFPETAVRALAEAWRYRKYREKPTGDLRTFPIADSERDRVAEILKTKSAGGGGFLNPSDTSFILQTYGFPMAGMQMTKTLEEAAAAAERMGVAVALKAVGERLVHKSDIGAVVLDLQGRQQVLGAGRELTNKLTAISLKDSVEGFLVQEMVEGGHEVILGMTLDRTFGPLVMFGLGGKYVEIFKDVCFRIVPITDDEAQQMLRSIVGYPILAGARGERPVDLAYLGECLERLSRLVETFEEIEEIDINPLVCFEQRERFRVIDARIRVRPSPSA